MRVAHVVHSLKVGGAEMLVAQMVRALHRDGLEPPVVACLDAVGALGEELRREGYVVQNVARRPGVDLTVVGRLTRLLVEQRVDVVHCHQYTPWFYGGIAANRARLPVVFTEHGRHQPDRPRWRRMLFNKWLLRQTRAITAVSRSIREALVENEGLPRRRIELLYNGVPHQRHRPDPVVRSRMRQELDLAEDCVAIGHAGRLVPVKNQSLLLRALARLRERQPEGWRAFLAGSGPLERPLRHQLEELGLGDRVTLLGERADVPDLLRAWDLFVLSSHSEGTSVTLLEAMATGLPVVATAVGGNPELVEDGVQGLLVEPDEPETLGAALAELAADAPRRARMGVEGMHRVEERFSFDGMLSRFEEIYREVAR